MQGDLGGCVLGNPKCLFRVFLPHWSNSHGGFSGSSAWRKGWPGGCAGKNNHWDRSGGQGRVQDSAPPQTPIPLLGIQTSLPPLCPSVPSPKTLCRSLSREQRSHVRRSWGSGRPPGTRSKREAHAILLTLVLPSPSAAQAPLLQSRCLPAPLGFRPASRPLCHSALLVLQASYHLFTCFPAFKMLLISPPVPSGLMGLSLAHLFPLSLSPLCCHLVGF